MRIVAISDTHNLHYEMLSSIPEGDVLVCAGDITNRGELFDVKSFCEWLGGYPHQNKIVIAGNHDWCFADNRSPNAIAMVNRVATYLQGSSVTINGVKFWGSPYTPWFHDWAFNFPYTDLESGVRAKEHWSTIPIDANVVVTHGPIRNVLDKVLGGFPHHVGCVELAKELLHQELRRPHLKLHICGHIHEEYGLRIIDGVTYVNASICNRQYEPVNTPIIVDI